MTTPLLALQAAHVFDPVPLRAGVQGLHVPFDDLLMNRRTEAELTRAVLAWERVAVSGRSGVGKTSAIQYALDSADSVAQLRVPVDAEDEQTVREPAAFAAHFVRTVSRQLVAARRLDTAARGDLLASAAASTHATRRTRRSGLGLPRWVVDATIATEVEQVTTANLRPSAEEVIDQARAVVDAVAAHDLVPVIVIDDSDAWLSTAAGDRSSMVGPFFSRVVRMLAEEMRAALVVAVHDHYLGMPAFATTAGFVEQRIEVPALPDAARLARILDGRLSAYDDLLSLDEVLEREAVELLFACYGSAAGNIRVTLLLAHTALQAACEDDSSSITRRHVEVAMTRFPTATSAPAAQ